MAGRVSTTRAATLLRSMQLGSVRRTRSYVEPFATQKRSAWLQSPLSATRLVASIVPQAVCIPRKISDLLSCKPARCLATTISAPQVIAPPIPSTAVTSPPPKILHQSPNHNFPRARAVRRRFKASMKKLNLVCKLVRRARVDAALMQLALSYKRLARVVQKAIYEAKFNAANVHGMDPDNLVIDEIAIGRSSYLKRMEYKARGRTGVRRKPFCYMAVYVREIQSEDNIDKNHLRRRRPRWKCGSVRM